MSRSLLSADDPKVAAFAQACEENRNAAHPTARIKLVIEEKRAYIYVDEVGAEAAPPYVHRSGRFLINRETGLVHTIRGYGKRGHIVGSVEGLTEAYRAGTASFAGAIPGISPTGEEVNAPEEPEPPQRPGRTSSAAEPV